jgi:hypothetical protein
MHPHLTILLYLANIVADIRLGLLFQYSSLTSRGAIFANVLPRLWMLFHPCREVPKPDYGRLQEASLRQHSQYSWRRCLKKGLDE